MQELTIAMALIEQGDSYLLQRRGSNPQIGGAGLLGCFGGKVEPGETPRQTVARELGEETNLQQPEDMFTELGVVEVISDYRQETVKVYGHSFALRLPRGVVVKAHEGELVALQKSKIQENLVAMTTGTRAVFEQYVMAKTFNG